jgi:hypothetical protein
MLPNLFVIGAARAGTTSLQHYLMQHPEIFMSPVKEPNYFAFAGGVPAFNGPDIAVRDRRLRDRLARERYTCSVVDASTYQRLFARAGRRPVRGDCSPAYMPIPAAAPQIRGVVPDAKIVAILRNPVDRAYSKFLQMRRDRAEPLASFAEALAAEPSRERDGWSPTWLYAKRGYYHRQLEPFFRYFGEDRVHVMLYDDLQRHPDSCMRMLFDFLGVDTKVPLDLSRQHNMSAELDTPRHDWLYDRLVRPYLLSPRLQAAVPAGLATLARPIARRILLRREAALAPAPLTMEVRAMLLGRYAEDIERLERLIGRDLSHWLAPAPRPQRGAVPAAAPAVPRLLVAA